MAMSVGCTAQSRHGTTWYLAWPQPGVLCDRWITNWGLPAVNNYTITWEINVLSHFPPVLITTRLPPQRENGEFMLTSVSKSPQSLPYCSDKKAQMFTSCTNQVRAIKYYIQSFARQSEFSVSYQGIQSQQLSRANKTSPEAWKLICTHTMLQPLGLTPVQLIHHTPSTKQTHTYFKGTSGIQIKKKKK